MQIIVTATVLMKVCSFIEHNFQKTGLSASTFWSWERLFIWWHICFTSFLLQLLNLNWIFMWQILEFIFWVTGNGLVPSLKYKFNVHVLTPVYLINITTLIIFSQLYNQLCNSNTVLEKLPPHRQSVYCNALQASQKNDHPAALFIYFIESPFLLQCVADADLVECNPSTVRSTPGLFNTVTHHLEIVDVVMCLWGLTKLIKSVWSFWRFLVFLVHCSKWFTTLIHSVYVYTEQCLISVTSCNAQ